MSSPRPLEISPLTAWCAGAIRWYQRRFSPSMTSSCRYVPSCSQYGEVAYLRYGPLYGFALTLVRLLRCSPLGAHGYDPVPDRRDGRPDPVGTPIYDLAGPCDRCAALSGSGAVSGSNVG